MRTCTGVIRQAVVFVWVLVGLSGWAPSLLAAGDELRMTYAEMRSKGRPADFYRLGFIADENICNDALGVLNRPIAVRPGLRLGYDYAKIHSDFFLRTSASIVWEPRWVVDGTGPPAGGVLDGAGVLDTAIIDIFNTGQPVEFYRFESNLGSAKLHVGHAGSGASKANNDSSSTVGSMHGLRTYVIDKTSPDHLGPILLMDPGFVREALAMPEDPLAVDPWSSIYVFFDVIKIRDSYYVLITSALFSYGDAKVYLAAFAGHRQRRVICEFKSRYEVVTD